MTVDGASFVGLFVSRDAIRTVGYPDPDLFLYGDDVLYTLALTRAGHALSYDPSIRFEHACETALPNAPITPLWKAYFYHRNQVFVYRELVGRVLFWPLLTLRAALWHARANRYGDQAPLFRDLLRLALRDGLAADRSRTRADVEAWISAQPISINGSDATTAAPTPPSPAPE